MRLLRVPLATLLACLLAGAQGGQFTVQKVFTSKQSGSTETPYTPKVGENYRIAITYSQSGVTAPYDIRFNCGGLMVNYGNGPIWPTTHVTDVSNGTKTVACDVYAPIDDLVPVVVTLDPDKSDATSGKMSFTPTPPTAALEFYNTNAVHGGQITTYTLQVTKPYEFQFMSSVPCTDGWEKCVWSKCTVNCSPGTTQPVPLVVNEGPWPNPLDFWVGKNLKATKIVVAQEWDMQLSDQRVNPGLLRQVSWGDIDALKGINVFKYFVSPEPIVQSNDPAITAFVNGVLGNDYRHKYTPYDAARKAFIAVAHHCKYTYPDKSKGIPDMRAPDAVAMCKTGLGDCGSYSMFLTAVLRNIGIPARCSVGYWTGGGGHCWTEMFMPRAGWIIDDACACSCLSDRKTGGALWFGDIPESHARYAQERGSLFKYADGYATMLQGPMRPIVTGATILKEDCVMNFAADTTPGGYGQTIAGSEQKSMASFDAKSLKGQLPVLQK